MMINRKLFLLVWFVMVLMGCQSGETPVVTNTSVSSNLVPTATVVVSPPTTITIFESQQDTATPIPLPTETLVPNLQPLSPFRIDWAEPFAGELITGEEITLTTWIPQSYAGDDISLPLNLSQISNAQVLDGLTAEQKAFLTTNGFVIIHSQEAQFGDIRVETAIETGQPYFLTVDAAFHALHLLFDDLLKALEREHFRPQILDITRAILAQVLSAYPEMQGTSLEDEAQQALAYLSVALKLFDPKAEIDPSVADLVSQQVDQIMAVNGRSESVIFPDFEDDYGAYKPVGHYAGDPDLEAYFRGMTWFGRTHFLLQDPENPNFVPSRVPLVITLALRRARIDDQSASDAWGELHKTLTFIVGPSDDAGPIEYAELMDQVYGSNLDFDALADDALWQEFLSQSEQLPAPQINSLFVVSTVDLTPEKGWRFMGQRFTLDGMILQNVIFDRVEAKPDNTRREIPSGLDVMAAFGSLPAFQELENQGITEFPNYLDQLDMMQQAIIEQPEEQWLGRFYDGWLYSFFPVLQPKDSAYPAYMQTSAWSYKDLNAALGSWAELKHDTVLYSKMPEMAGGGGPPMSNPAPSYVEPNPNAFYRMAYLAQTLSCGLQNLMFDDPCYLGITSIGPPDSVGYVLEIGDLGVRFATLGNIATKELAGQPLDDNENYFMTQCLGFIECLNKETPYRRPNSEMPKVPVVAAVSGADNSVLEVGVGNVDRIYVIVPLEGEWEVAQGGIFSYYEFVQPRNDRLTDDEWREKLTSGSVEMPLWASNFVLPGGQPSRSLFFRVDDVYIITEAGDQLNVRDQPSLSGQVVTQLETGSYVIITDGPVYADGYTWWEFSLGYDSPPIGWAVEDQQWYERSYND